jgi:cytochrome c peroxidase
MLRASTSLSRTERLALAMTILALALALALAAGAGGCARRHDPAADWTEAELRTIASLWIARLGKPTRDFSNRHASDPGAAALGHALFFDARLSANGQVACATCHQPAQYFTDGLGSSRGLGQTRRSAPTLVGACYGSWFYWDGRRDSQWSQALTPLEAPAEMGSARVGLIQRLAGDALYRAQYARVFGPLPDVSDRGRFPPDATPRGAPEQRARWDAMAPADRAAINRAFSNLGKALAAYQCKLVPGASRFDRYVETLLGVGADVGPALTAEEVAGLRLFIGRGQCLRCHNGPLFTNHGFHNIGLPPLDPEQPDLGRIAGLAEALADEFNCLSPYSDAPAQECRELRFAKREGIELPGAFKVPSLRSIARTAPYMHAGQLPTLGAVLAHYSEPGAGSVGHQELTPRRFSAAEMRQLEAFLGALDSPIAGDPRWLAPPAAASLR